MKKNKHQLSGVARGVAVAILMSGIAAQATAGFQGHQPGPVMTLGKTTNTSTLLSLVNNPSASEQLIKEDESFRMGYLSSIGMSLEFGDLDNAVEDIEELEDILDNDNLNINDVNTAKAKFDEVLPVLGDDMDVALDFGVHIPLFPMAIRSELLGGVLSFDLRNSLMVNLGFLDAPLKFRLVDGEYEGETESSLYLKAANLFAGTIGYSREIWSPPVWDSKIYGGININAYHASLNKQVISLQAAAEDDDDIGDIVSDEFSENTESAAAVGIDLGVTWKFPYAQVGMTIANINEPEFDYGRIGSNCTELSGLREKNCNAAKAFADEINLNETAVLTAQTTIEGSIFTRERMFLISGSYDLNSAYNLVGRESQMASAAISFDPNSYIIPTLRVSASRNMVGSELTTVGFGTTLFGMLNIDLAASLDTVERDGEELPRYVGFNIGLEEKF